MGPLLGERACIRGSFTNHVDKILTLFDHPPTSCGQTWTFQLPPTYVHVDIYGPTPFYQFDMYHKIYNTNRNFLCKKKPFQPCLVSAADICTNYMIFASLFPPTILHFSTWTFKRPPTYLAWTIMDI